MGITGNNLLHGVLHVAPPKCFAGIQINVTAHIDYLGKKHC